MITESKEVAPAQKAQPTPDEIDRILQVVKKTFTNTQLIHISDEGTISSIISISLKLLQNPAFKIKTAKPLLRN